ncbi:lysophospholipid acyltransferase family protein [Planctomycetota bacterium]
MAQKRSRRWRRIDKRNRPIEHRIQYICLRVMVAIMGLIPMDVNLRVWCFFGRLLWYGYGRGRQRALENLRASYPNRDHAWYVRTGRRSFEHLAMLAVDAMLTPRIVRKDNWREYSCYKNTERVKWLMQEGRGILLVTGHYGNFEIMGYVLSLFGFKLYSVARPLDNPFIDQYLRGIREEHGQHIIDKKGASEFMELVTSQGASLGLIADQDAGRKGIFADFFGRKASVYKSIALLAATQNMPIAVGGARRIGNRFFFEMSCNRLIMPQEWADKDDPLTWITAEYTKAIEDFVREDPTQYWWVHRRWKTRPREELSDRSTV